MARQQLEIMTSDISRKQIAAGSAVIVTVTDHPLLDGRAIELDVDITEVEKLVASNLTTVSLKLKIPGEPLRRIVVNGAVFDELFKGNVADVFLKARPAGSYESRGRKRTRLGDTAPSIRNQKTDYTDADHFGQLHRGRVTEQEAALVRANLAQASKNRAAVGQPRIDPTDDAEKKRYGL